MHTDFSQIGEVYFALCKSVDTPVSLGLWLRFKYGEHRQLAEFSIRPEWYTSAASFQMDYVVSEYLSKYKGLETGINTKEVAVQKFKTSEDRCRETNHRIRTSRIRGYNPRVDAVIHIAQRKISQILREYDISLWLSRCKWGPGATFSLKGLDAHLDNKIREDQTSITCSAIPYFRRVISDDYHWLYAKGIEAHGPTNPLNCFKQVNGGKVTTVPKNAKTDRTIVIEPTANQFLQGGIGSYIRSRLKTFGIDLNTQINNNSAARLGSIQGELATVDLSAASDTISTELIYELLPLDWAMTLDDLRSKFYVMDKTWHKFEKFSSMGNGFTFELETMLFYALSRAVCEFLSIDSRVLVYGDDIVIHRDCLPLLREVFDFCGFSFNMEKTHSETPFRESCGKHYFDGYDVTPIYQKEIPNVLEEVYRMANRIRRLAYSMGSDIGCLRVYRSAWFASVRVFGKDLHKLQHAVPLDSQDDDGLALPINEIPVHIFCTRLHNIEGVRLKVLSFKPKSLSIDSHEGLLAYALRFTPDEPFNGRVSVRRRGKYLHRRRYYRTRASDASWL